MDNRLDMSIFDERYKNDNTGAPAYDPAILLKIVIYAYSRGIMREGVKRWTILKYTILFREHS